LVVGTIGLSLKSAVDAVLTGILAVLETGTVGIAGIEPKPNNPPLVVDVVAGFDESLLVAVVVMLPNNEPLVVDVLSAGLALNNELASLDLVSVDLAVLPNNDVVASVVVVVDGLVPNNDDDDGLALPNSDELVSTGLVVVAVPNNDDDDVVAVVVSGLVVVVVPNNDDDDVVSEVGLVVVPNNDAASVEIGLPNNDAVDDDDDDDVDDGAIVTGFENNEAAAESESKPAGGLIVSGLMSNVIPVGNFTFSISGLPKSTSSSSDTSVKAFLWIGSYNDPFLLLLLSYLPDLTVVVVVVPFNLIPSLGLVVVVVDEKILLLAVAVPLS